MAMRRECQTTLLSSDSNTFFLCAALAGAICWRVRAPMLIARRRMLATARAIITVIKKPIEIAFRILKTEVRSQIVWKSFN